MAITMYYMQCIICILGIISDAWDYIHCILSNALYVLYCMHCIMCFVPLKLVTERQTDIGIDIPMGKTLYSSRPLVTVFICDKNDLVMI